MPIPMTMEPRSWNVRGDALRVDALADSLVLRLLSAMGASGTLVGGAALSSMGTSSLPALKSYLLGQQYYRRGNTDSSRLAFESAVATDSLFALGWRGIASTYIRTGREGTPEAQAAIDRAIRLRRGGSPRDSLLLHGDALRLAVVRRASAANDALADVPDLTALLRTLREAVARYPTDAELWMELGDADFHFGELAGVSLETVLQDFSHAIALDSMVLVPYAHAYTAALRLGKLGEAATLARAVMRLSSAERAPYFELQVALLDSAPAISTAARRLLDSLPAGNVAFSLQELASSPQATALTLAVAEQQRVRLSQNPALPDSAGLARVVLLAQALRGKRVATPQLLQFGDRTQLALIGLLPVDAVAQEARAIIARQPASAGSALGLLASIRDTASLLLVLPAFDSLDVAARAQGGERRAFVGRIARAFVALARADSASALRDFLAVPMSTSGGAPCAALVTSRLLASAGRDGDAARVLDRALPNVVTQLSAPLLMQERALVAERMGDRAKAREWYTRIVAQWADGDTPVHAVRDAAKASLTRLR